MSSTTQSIYETTGAWFTSCLPLGYSESCYYSSYAGSDDGGGVKRREEGERGGGGRDEVNRRECGGGVKRRKEEEKKKKSIRKKVWKASKKRFRSLMTLGGVSTPVQGVQRGRTRRGEDIQMVSGVPTTQTMTRRARPLSEEEEEESGGGRAAAAALVKGESGSVYFDAAEWFDEAPSTAEEHGQEEEEEQASTPSSCSSFSAAAAAAAAAGEHDEAHGPRKRTRVDEDGTEDNAEVESSMMMMNTERVEPVYRGTLPTQFYGEPPSCKLNIRGKNYLEDRVKVPAGEPAMELVAVDLLEGDAPVHNVGGACDGTAQKIVHNADRPLFICNFVVPGATWINFVMYFRPRSSSVLLEDSSFATLFRRFRERDQEYRDASFKIIPQVVKGPWIVQRSVGSGTSSVPVILGRRLKIDYFCTPSYVEVDVNVHSSSIAASITKLVRSMTKLVVIDIAFLLEGKTEDELPEKLIGVFRMDHMPMTAATKFTPTPMSTPHTTRTVTRASDDDNETPTQSSGPAD